MSKENFLSPVNDLMVKVEGKMLTQAAGHHPDLIIALEHLLSSGGKRIRPAIALLCGGMLQGDNDNLVTLAAAIELLHTATLVHDDLIDGALLRRGIATLNSQWSPAATVLTGDFIFARAAKMAAETNSVSVMKMFADTLAIIVDGEVTQLFNRNGLPSEEDYYQRIYAKTASMFELATGASALLSPVDESTVLKMRKFGYYLGMSFQIVDDVLDFIGDEMVVGKPVASDLRQGLVTLPVIYYLKIEPDDSSVHLLLQGEGDYDGIVDRLVNQIRASGAIQLAIEKARKYLKNGELILNEMPESRQKDALRQLIDYIINRNF
jgi:geranylgeranyl pyrophosphate synthase